MFQPTRAETPAGPEEGEPMNRPQKLVLGFFIVFALVIGAFHP
jgi:hypothetical protein